MNTVAVRVLIVDDSLFFRKRLAEIISADLRLEVIATAANGQEALEQVQLFKPDIVTMDFEMPIMDGVATVRKIMQLRPTPVMMLSTWTTQGAKSTLDALDAGAVDFLPKQFEDLSTNHSEAQRQICERIYQLAKEFQFSSKEQSISTPVQPAVATKVLPTEKTAIELVAIGSSTGGPLALPKVLTQLPANFPQPILLVQHMPATFTPSFAERLNDQCAIHIKQAQNGDSLVAGTAYLAPGGQQMTLKGRRNHLYLHIEDGLASHTYKPCIDITLGSIAQICPAETLAIILTGMGADGRDGCQAIHQQNGRVWAQDQQSSTIYGMPMAVTKAGLTDRILSLTNIGRHLAELH